MKNDIIKFLCVSGIEYSVTSNRVYIIIGNKSEFEHNYRRLDVTFSSNDTYEKFIKRCKKLGITKCEDISLMYCLIQLNIPLHIDFLDRGRGGILLDIYIYSETKDYGGYYEIGQILTSDCDGVFIESNKIDWNNIESRINYFKKNCR